MPVPWPSMSKLDAVLAFTSVLKADVAGGAATATGNAGVAGRAAPRPLSPTPTPEPTAVFDTVDEAEEGGPDTAAAAGEAMGN